MFVRAISTAGSDFPCEVFNGNRKNGKPRLNVVACDLFIESNSKWPP